MPNSPRFQSPAGRAKVGLVAALVLLAHPALAQWSTQSPVPTHLNVGGIAAPAPGRLFLATDDDGFDTSGALWESSDSGATWVQRNVPFNLYDGLFGVAFRTDQHGWAWGNLNYRTTDGGTTWAELPQLGSTYYLDFHTASFGVASGNFGVYTSTDGGLTWAPSPQDMVQFEFATDQVGLGVAVDGIYRTTDGGVTFTLVHAGAAARVVYLSPTTAVAIVDDTFARSTDGGLTWTTGEPALGRTDLAVVSADVVLASGRTGVDPDFDDRLLRSADGGLSWTDLGEVIAVGQFLAPPSFVAPSSTVVVAGDGGGNLFRSADAGVTWAQVFATPGPTPSSFSSTVPVFVDATIGYYAFGAGFIVATADAGATWSQLSSGSGVAIADLDRFPNGDRIAVGESGQVLTSAAASTSWQLRASLTVGALEAVQVLGAQEAVVVDQGGLVSRSTDGGATWTAASPLPLELSAKDLHFESSLDGWVVGGGFAGAALFHTVNGGASWTPVTDFVGTWVAVDFEGPKGWIVAYDGALARTINGGGSWVLSQLPGDFPAPADIDFFDANVGYAVGWSGYAARSGDGGASWQLLPIPQTNDNLTDIYLVGPNELWVSMAGGKALYSATGGQDWAVMDAGPAGFGAYTSIVANPAGDAWMAGWQGLIRHFAGPPTPPVNQPPSAAFSSVTTGLSVAFTDTSSDNDGTITSWAWDFGDGELSTVQNPQHTFAVANTYIVTLTVTDNDGDSDSTIRILAVQPGPGGTFGDFTEVTPLDPLFVTPQDEDFWVTSAASADYDGDGDLDIVVLGYYVVYNQSVDERLVLIRNDGAVGPGEWELSYIELPLGTLIAGASDLAWGDADGDGDQDLVVGSDGQTVLYRNNGGDLVQSNTVLPGYWEDNSQADFDLQSISWADYDNDGDLDLLLPSVWDFDLDAYRTVLMRNDGPNGSGGVSFTDVATSFAATSHAQSTWADFDGDQDLDLLLVNLAPLAETGFIRRYRNDGEGVFVGEDILGTLTIEHGEAQWGDSDGDGDLDILVAGNIQELDGSYTTVLRLYRNDAEVFNAVELIDCVFCEGWFDLSAATWADYDSDGDIDILLAGSYNSGSNIEGRAKVYDNVGGVFVDSGNQLPAPRASGSRGGSFAWLDLDGEGDLDYFIAGQYFVPGGNGLVEAQMHLYTNDAEGQNQPPTAPLLLGSQTFLDGSANLWWNAASDDSTPTDALTYDLRLYRSGVPVSQSRRYPQPGAVSSANAWSLAGLPNGNYSWTLEAVDSAFNSGPKVTSTFRIGPPLVSIFADGFESGGVGAWSAVGP